jgi:hypothetical protein
VDADAPGDEARIESAAMRRRTTALVLLVVASAAVVAWRGCSIDEAPAPTHAPSPRAAPIEPPQARTKRRASAPESVATTEAAPTRVAPTSPASPTKRTLRLLDRVGDPVADVQVMASGFDPVRTDARGEATFEAPVEAVQARFLDRGVERTVELREPVTEVRTRSFPRIDVRVVDGATGDAVDAPWRAARRYGTARPSDDSPRLETRRNGRSDAEVSVEPPTGYGALEPYGWTGAVASRATTVRIVVPVWRERPIELRLVDESGRAVEGARADAFVTNVYGVSRDVGVTHDDARSDRDGLLKIGRVPGAPFVRLSFRVGRPCDDDRAYELGATIRHIPLGESAPTTPETVVLTRRKYDRSFVSTGGSGSGSRKRSLAGERAPLVVRCVHRDGLPAARVWIDIGGDVAGETGDDGTLRVESAPIGPRELLAFAHGFLPTTAHADVGRDVEVVVRESSPHTVRVTVVDEPERPLMGAVVNVRCEQLSGSDRKVGCSVAQLDGDVELATPMTGRDGVVTLDVPRGTNEYRATLGAAGEAVSSDSDFVRVVLRPPKD